ncbi:unnamed protein product [Phyllotreta striolata]|uniref:Potassium channel domain-containing protein n=1 Tax=Phyllotreta striolata TaxID=444603 RepID=A0A9N9TKP9_PHYSR|nr:unnamed protein product [Phyllotreta striolata]
MMSKKQWFVLLCLFILYLLLGASIFYYIESQEERIQHAKESRERRYIEELLKSNYEGNDENVHSLFDRLSDYCGKPVHYNMSSEPSTGKWNYYNSLFFVITVVSTIGYGNLSPTTMFTRIFMIFYGLIGIPMNGIVMVTLGDYFGKSFTKLYERWKTLRLEKHSAKLGLIGQIILYAVPGLTFFIFLPATIISFFEGWDYDVAVYYAFVTLTTIGFGDYVAGPVNVHGFDATIFLFYHVFLLVWVIGGLGYLLMIIGFITKAMRSRKIVQIEKLLAHKVKTTPLRIRNEIRSLLHEFLFMRVKPVYKEPFDYTPNHLDRTQSCPDLVLWKSEFRLDRAVRKRAMSECYKYNVLERVQSESHLDRIDKERTFRPSDALMKQKDLLLKVVDALSLASESSRDEPGGFFGDSQAPPSRRRAFSDVNPPGKYPDTQSGNTWYGNDALTALNAFKQRRERAMSTADRADKTSVLQKFQRNVASRLWRSDRDADVEKQALEQSELEQGRLEAESTPDGSVLEQTSIADFIRALSALTTEEEVEESAPRKMSVAQAQQARKLSYLPNLSNRRSSLLPPGVSNKKPRRFSMTPVIENALSPSASPPSYFEISAGNLPTEASSFSSTASSSALRKFSVRPVPVQLQKRRRTLSGSKDKDKC